MRGLYCSAVAVVKGWLVRAVSACWLHVCIVSGDRCTVR